MSLTLLDDSKESLEAAAADTVYAAMETGNIDRARSFLIELSEDYPEFARRIADSIKQSYGRSLL